MFNIPLTIPVIFLLGLSGLRPVLAENVTTALIGNVLRGIEQENIVFSPTLVSESLMQLYMAAEGETDKQMEQLLKLNGLTKHQGLREIAKRLQRLRHRLFLNTRSRIYVSQDLELQPYYQQKSSKVFRNMAEKVDFGDTNMTILQMNEWISIHNQSSVIGEWDINNDTKIISLSAMHFQESWKHQFNPLYTRKAPFFVPLKDGEFQTVAVDTMERRGKYKYSYIDQLQAYSIAIPYEESDLNMIILLPKDMDGVQTVVDKLETLHIHEIIPHEYKTHFRLLLPKFKVDCLLKLKSALESLGIRDLFTDANLNTMTGLETGVFVNELIQKTDIEINEEGYEAETINKVDFGKISRQYVAEVNHPFLFFVMDRSNIYLAGRINSLK